MAEPQRNEIDLTFQGLGSDPLALEGLEQLLEFGHVDLVENAVAQPELGEAVVTEGSGPVSSEIKLILDLLGQIESINELVLETGYKLHKAHDRMVDLEYQLKQQEKMAQRITELEAEVSRMTEMETWLDAVITENDRLKRPLWKKVFGIKTK
ncbi:MAG: hypothetical protein JSS83_21930 [Cyanobacteria bacterium SZAS LIN-3]|nr:hypothetical protein [Cyanobacteria bacterium SZAS LIN-3]MBS2008557.1 hypothetical protein [Cyanobacteria bacterium SZAS TMP-1]